MLFSRMSHALLSPASSDEGRLFFLVLSVILAYWFINAPSSGPHIGANVDSSLHQVEQNYWKARNHFKERVKHQSKSHFAASREYRKRYNRNPPCGFDKWFRLAKSWNSTFIDDFDDINYQLRPFQDYLKQDCYQKEWKEDRCTANKLVQLCFRDGNTKLCGQSNERFSKGIEMMTSMFQSNMPDFCVFLNPMDQPRLILPPPTDQDVLDLLQRKKERLKSNEFVPKCPSVNFLNMQRQKIWSEATMFCPEDSPVRSGSRLHDRSFLLPFQYKPADQHKVMDLCLYDQELPHGLLQSPEELSLTHDIVPVLSQGKLSSWGDVVFPSPYRIAKQSNQTEFDNDKLKWALKKLSLYWRGPTTGGHARPRGWSMLHRQHAIQTLRKDANPAVDVAFTDVVQCQNDACEAQRSALPIATADTGDVWKAKWLLDMDGNGPSEELYDLLRSNSVVIRHSLFQEWHDQRLTPWLHYIPLTPEVGEADELLSYLSSPAGDEVVRKIATESRKFAETALRIEDMTLYFYRILLEMARHHHCKKT